MNGEQVWVLQIGHYDSTHVVGVFASLEAAKAVPVDENEVYSRNQKPEDREWKDEAQVGGEPGGWWRKADSGWITEHTVDLVPTFGDKEGPV